MKNKGTKERVTIEMDLGDKTSRYCVLWVTGEVYEPLRNHNSRQQRKKIAA